MSLTALTPDYITNYLNTASLRDTDVLIELQAETANLPLAEMQISRLQGQFMQLLIKLMGAKHILELGTFTGYSSLAMALALPDNGKVITCDINSEWTNIAKAYWKKANVLHKIELKLGEALTSLDQMITSSMSNYFDFVFIDADKANYPFYYEKALMLTRPGGLIVLDNALLNGKVADSAAQENRVQIMRDLNHFIREDVRVDMSLVPIADGLVLARKI